MSPNTDHIFPRLPVRQWVLSVPKRLRYFLQNDPKALNTSLRIFLRVIHTNLHQHCASAAGIDKHASHLGACAFIHRFGSSLNTHVHFHICVIDGVFEAGEPDSGDNKDGNASVIFHAASPFDAAAIAKVQSEVKQRIVRAFVKRGLLDALAGKAMIDTQHGGGFSVDASVCIGSDDRAGLERLLRYCARPPFAMERLHPKGKDKLLYHCPKPQPGGKQGDLVLTPLELIDKLDALVPPPRTHRHRYFGVLAPNSPLRGAVNALASHPEEPLSPADREIQVDTPATTRRSPAHYLWAVLIARIYAVFPLLCPHCGGEMRLIGFVNEGAEVKKILDYIGEPSTPPKISQARGPPMWDAGESAQPEVFNAGPDWTIEQQIGPAVQFDQSVNW